LWDETCEASVVEDNIRKFYFSTDPPEPLINMHTSNQTFKYYLNYNNVLNK